MVKTLYLLPLIIMILDSLYESKVSIKLDLKNTYYTIRIR